MSLEVRRMPGEHNTVKVRVPIAPRKHYSPPAGATCPPFPDTIRPERPLDKRMPGSAEGAASLHSFPGERCGTMNKKTLSFDQTDAFNALNPAIGIPSGNRDGAPGFPRGDRR